MSAELTQVTGHGVSVRFFMPTARLAPYVSAYYLTDFNLASGTTVRDWLHPEWANLRFSLNNNWRAGVGSEPMRKIANFVVTGPTSHCTQFETGPGRAWGIGILPLGWARLFGTPAAGYADRFCDGATDPVFAAMAPLLGALFTGDPDPAAEAERIEQAMLQLLDRRPMLEDERRIQAAHAALIDDGCSAVANLADTLCMSTRSLERFSLRAFGFSPKLLLRRQRFLRSLAQFMLDPSLTWVSMLDWQYVDQAHFVRDFHRFMGMSPSVYAGLDHPVLRAAASARAAAAGAAVQALHPP